MAARLALKVILATSLGFASFAAAQNSPPQLLADFQSLKEVASRTGPVLWPWLFLAVVSAIALAMSLWWVRKRRLTEQRRSLRAFHTLSENIIAAASPAEIMEKLSTILPRITQATAVRLYLFNRRTNSLERVPAPGEPEPMAVSIDMPQEGLAGGAVACFRNRALLNIPDVRRSPIVQSSGRSGLPRSAMFVPLFAQTDLLGVLEAGNARRPGYFTVEEQAACQHIANQIATSLKLQERQTAREQLFRSEKLAATGQLISGVANELRAPLESIFQLARSLGRYSGQPVPERDLRQLAGESQRASEIVSRLVSFARPEDSTARLLDVNALLGSLALFREPEWKSLGLRAQNRLSPEPALVLGVQGQMEQVFLNLLVHAEQCAAQTSAKILALSSTSLGQRATVEINHSSEGLPADPFAESAAADSGALGLGVCQGIVRNHGGELQYRFRSGIAQFEIELPLVRENTERRTAGRTRDSRPLTVMLVDPDACPQRQLVGLLARRGHRVVPAPPDEASDLVQRFRFDAVFSSMRLSGGVWTELHARIRPHSPAFVLLAEGYDAELARNVKSAGALLVLRPIQEAELDRLESEIESRSASRAHSS